MKTLTVSIAGVTVEVTLPAGPVAAELAQGWADFVTRAPPKVRVVAELTSTPEHQGPRTMPVATATSLTGEDFDARQTPQHLAVRSSGRSRFPFDATLKWVLAREVAETGGLVLHGVALASREKGALFVAESGGGKSTLGELRNSQLTRLSDELVVLTEDLRLHGTPWNAGTPGSAPAALLGTLGWSTAPRFEPLTASELVPLLLGNTLLPDESPAARARAFHCVTGALRSIPTVRFFFPPDARAADFLVEKLSG